MGPAARAGGTAFVAGTAVFGTKDYRAAIEALRREAEQARASRS
jgi:ribulose-phosphate 3-epimerase